MSGGLGNVINQTDSVRTVEPEIDFSRALISAFGELASERQLTSIAQTIEVHNLNENQVLKELATWAHSSINNYDNAFAIHAFLTRHFSEIDK